RPYARARLRRLQRPRRRPRLPCRRAGWNAAYRTAARGDDRGPVRRRRPRLVRDWERWAMNARRASWLLAALAALVCGGTIAAPLPEHGYGLPRDVSYDGFRIDELIHFTLAA